MGRQYKAVPYASWPKPTSPQSQSALHRFKIRSEVLFPELFPNKRRRGSPNPNQRVLYDISEPMSDIDGEEENVRSPSRSSVGTVRGDNTNSGSGSPVRGEDIPLDRGNNEPPLPSRNSVQPYAQESASTLLNDDWNGWDRNRDHDATNEDSAKPRVAQLLDHDSELNGLRDSRQSSLDSQVRGLSNDLSKLPDNGHGGRSCISNGMKRKRRCTNLLDSEDLPSSPPLLPNYTANNAQEGLELLDDEIETSDISDWDQQYRHPMRSDKRRGYESGSDYWRSSSQRSSTHRSSTHRSSTHRSSTHRSSTHRSSTQRSSTQPGQSGSQGQEFMMSGALADGPPNTSTISLPDDMWVHDKVKSGPNCFCKHVPAGTETYQGHCHIIHGITVKHGEQYFQCGLLCSDDIVSVPFDYFKSSCPDQTRRFLSQLTL